MRQGGTIAELPFARVVRIDRGADEAHLFRRRALGCGQIMFRKEQIKAGGIPHLFERHPWVGREEPHAFGDGLEIHHCQIGDNKFRSACHAKLRTRIAAGEVAGAGDEIDLRNERSTTMIGVPVDQPLAD